MVHIRKINDMVSTNRRSKSLKVILIELSRKCDDGEIGNVIDVLKRELEANEIRILIPIQQDVIEILDEFYNTAAKIHGKHSR